MNDEAAAVHDHDDDEEEKRQEEDDDEPNPADPCAWHPCQGNNDNGVSPLRPSTRATGTRDTNEDRLRPPRPAMMIGKQPLVAPPKHDLAREFRQKTKCLFVYLPTWAFFTGCGFCNDDNNRPRLFRKYLLFFHFQLLYEWNKCLATVMLLNNMVAFVTTIVALFLPEDPLNSFLGGCSLLLGTVLLHCWFGYMQYPWVCDCDDDDDDDEDEDDDPPKKRNCLDPRSASLEGQRDNLAELRGGGMHSQAWATFLALIFVLPNLLGTFLTNFALNLVVLLLCCGKEECLEKQCIVRPLSFVAMFLGCCTWAIVFFRADNEWVKLFASFALLVNEELYLSYLLRKPCRDFLKSFVAALFADFAPLDELELLEGADEDQVEDPGEGGDDDAPAVEESVAGLPKDTKDLADLEAADAPGAAKPEQAPRAVATASSTQDNTTIQDETQRTDLESPSSSSSSSAAVRATIELQESDEESE